MNWFSIGWCGKCECSCPTICYEMLLSFIGLFIIVLSIVCFITWFINQTKKEDAEYERQMAKKGTKEDV